MDKENVVHLHNVVLHNRKNSDILNFAGKWNTSALQVGMQAGTIPLDISVAISQKIRKQPSSRPRNTTFGYIPKG